MRMSSTPEPFCNISTDSMSDLIRTIESDDEDLQLSAPASTSASALVDTKKRKRDGGDEKKLTKRDIKKQSKAKAGAKNDIKGKGKQVEDVDAIAGEFQFDALGGGEYLSRGARMGDAWVCLGLLDACHYITNVSCLIRM